MTDQAARLINLGDGATATLEAFGLLLALRHRGFVLSAEECGCLDVSPGESLKVKDKANIMRLRVELVALLRHKPAIM